MGLISPVRILRVVPPLVLVFKLQSLGRCHETIQAITSPVRGALPGCGEQTSSPAIWGMTWRLSVNPPCSRSRFSSHQYVPGRECDDLRGGFTRPQAARCHAGMSSSPGVSMPHSYRDCLWTDRERSFLIAKNIDQDVQNTLMFKILTMCKNYGENKEKL